jgi:hypothetical protein
MASPWDNSGPPRSGSEGSANVAADRIAGREIIVAISVRTGLGPPPIDDKAPD